ncbi:hypothetical protein ABN028_19400 [Actinopolymorpha sp. B17G11]|uniref:hypothetical protein n=1 Tax=Actinopolymorpha sp. B17G11 TaxID=3160861 RepID=UPI0032E49C48
MGGQKRYNQAVGGYEIPTGARRHDLDDAVAAIVAHVAESGEAGIYNGDGSWRAAINDHLLAPLLEGPDRVRRGERADGKDTILAASPGESYADVQDRLYRSRHYASPRMVNRFRIADVLYAGIGAGILERVPRGRVDDTVEMALQAIADGWLDQRMLASQCRGLREYLGLPAGEWTDSADEAAERGREMCGAMPTRPTAPEYDEDAWAL